MTTRQTLGWRIAQKRREKAVRDGHDITQADLAKAAKVSATSVSEWEANKKAPRDATLERIATYLGTTPAFLRYGVSPAKVQPGPTVPSPEERAEWMNHEKKAAKRASAEPEATKAAGGAKRRRRPH